MIKNKTNWKRIWYKTHSDIDIKPTYLESGELYCIEITVKKSKESNPLVNEIE